MLASAHSRLDIGCGSSRIIQSSPEAVGLDLSLPKLRFLRRTNSNRVLATAFSLPFAAASFDSLIHSNVIEHIEYDPSVFRELNRVLRPGGLLVIGTPDYGRFQWRWIERLYRILLPNGYGEDHITHYDRKRLTEELARVGFRIRSYRYILGAELILCCVKLKELGDGTDRKRSFGP